MRSWSGVGIAAFVVGLLASLPGASADDNPAIEDLKKENAELKKRVEKLEAALTKIEGAPEKPPAKEPSEEVIDKAVDKTIERLEAEAKKKPLIHSKYPVDLYGFIKLDAAYDTARINEGNYARWVESEQNRDSDNDFNMTARESRFGLNFHGPDVDKMKTSGRVEVDFYGGGAENKNLPMMRHCYFQVDWPEYDFGLLAGQTSDVVSPLVPSMLNYTVQWWAGNIGYRRPQIRLTKGFGLGDSKLVWQGAVARPIGHTTGFDPGDTGEDSGVPHIQSRVAYSFPLLTKKPTTFGISGHWGEEQWDRNARNEGWVFKTWSLCLDATVPIFDKLAFKGELWKGSNLDAYLGGIGQGVNPAWRDEIGDEGGWGEFTVGPFGKWTFNIGVSVDDPRNEDLVRGERASNRAIFGNILYDLNEAVRIGLEVSHWETDYLHREDGDAWRFQTSFIYTF